MLHATFGSCGERCGTRSAALVLALVGMLHEVCYVCASRVVAGEVGCDKEMRGVEREILHNAWYRIPSDCSIIPVYGIRVWGDDAV